MANTNRNGVSPAKLFVVVYRKGGTDNFTWHRSETFTNAAAALDCSAGVNRSGYPAHVEDYARSMSIGLPETYDVTFPVQANGPKADDRPSPFVEFASSETAYGRTVGYDFAVKVF